MSEIAPRSSIDRPSIDPGARILFSCSPVFDIRLYSMTLPIYGLKVRGVVRPALCLGHDVVNLRRGPYCS